MLDKNLDWIYECNKKNTERYVLGEVKKGSNILACIGINPSTAEPENLDNTLKRVKKITEYNGFDGWVMFNVYPQRATNPNEMDEEVNTKSFEKNVDEIIKTVKEYNIKNIWLAYGNNIEKRPYLVVCLREICNRLLELNVEWKIIGVLTKKGHPRHPLYNKIKSYLSEFNFDKYIKEKI